MKTVENSDLKWTLEKIFEDQRWTQGKLFEAFGLLAGLGERVKAVEEHQDDQDQGKRDGKTARFSFWQTVFMAVMMLTSVISAWVAVAALHAHKP